MFEDPGTPIIIDNGAAVCRAGLCGDDAPRSVFSTVVGFPHEHIPIRGLNNRQYILGDEVWENKCLYRQPIQNGVVADWGDMQKIWRHCFYN